MGYDITPQKVEEMRRFLLEHPLDPDYDENVIELDGDCSADQLRSRLYYAILKELGKLPKTE